MCPGELFIAELERDCPRSPAKKKMLCTGWRLDTSFVLDGEAVLFGVDGPSDFGGLHARRNGAEVEFYAFDIQVSDGEDVRNGLLSMRKARRGRLLARRVAGNVFPISRRGRSGGVGDGLQASRLYFRGGRFRHRIKVKNRPHPAFSRVMDPF